MDKIKDYVLAFCENGATDVKLEKISLKGKEHWTIVFKDEADSVYGAFSIKGLKSSELEELLDAIAKNGLVLSTEVKS